MTNIVATENLAKRYGKRAVVEGLNLRIPEGSIYGFLGPNGSGKSTTMKMLLGLTRPSRGEVVLFGSRLTAATRGSLASRIGSMVEAPPGYGHLTGKENLRIVQEMLGLPRASVEEALATVRLTEHQDKLVRRYSLGMKQRLGIAIALVREPELLVLDEPTNGLDPAGIEEIRILLVGLARKGITVMVSSHLLDEVDKMADVLGILSSGRLIFQGTRAELFRHSIPDLVVETPAAEAALGLEPAAVAVPGGIRLSGIDKEQTAGLVHRMAMAGLPIHEVRRVQQRLEDVFIDLTGRGGQL